MRQAGERLSFLLDAAELRVVFGPGAGALEVLDCSAGGFAACCLFGCVARVEGAEGAGAVDLEEACELVADGVVFVGWLRGFGGALEFWGCVC